MKKFESVIEPLMWSTALLLIGLAAGCGGGGDPILGGGGGGAIAGAPAGAIIPGAACSASGVGKPAVLSSNPTNGNSGVPVTTTGDPGNGKSIFANFDMAMASGTINTTTFTLAKVGNVALTPVTVSLVSPTVATLTTPSPLSPNTLYQAIITTGAQSASAVSLACPYAWSFTTAASGAGLAPINMGTAAPFGIAAHSNAGGVTNTPTLPITIINGDVLLNPVAAAACNAVAVDAAGGFGLCAGAPPTLGGTSKVYSPLYDPSGTLATVVADLNTAFLSITPPAGPPAAGSLGGATAIAAPTTLGAVTGSALVVGQNLFYPGVYQSITSILISNDLTLDAQGNPDAVFVFQSSSTIGTAAGAAPPGVRTRILLVNGAKASNVWWQAGSDATLQLYSEFQGNILAARDITMLTGATSCGRLMAGAWVGVGAGSGAFIFDSNVVSVPGKPFAPPATYSPICQ